MFTIRKVLRKIRLGFRFLHMRLGNQGRKHLLEYLLCLRHYQAIAPSDLVYSIPRTMIQHRLNEEIWLRWSFTPLMGGDWDRKVHPILQEVPSAAGQTPTYRIVEDGGFAQVKMKSIQTHFLDSLPWKNTELFQAYADRFKKEPYILHSRNVRELEKRYEIRYEQLYRSLASEGLLDSQPLPVYIDRKGRYLFGSDGNHRLAMAIALAIPSVPVKVLGRHMDWQDIREQVYRSEEFPDSYLHLIDHPDLKDVKKPAR